MKKLFFMFVMVLMTATAMAQNPVLQPGQAIVEYIEYSRYDKTLHLSNGGQISSVGMSPQFYGELNRAQVGSIIYARYDGGDLKVFTVVGQSAVVSRAYPSVIYSGDMYYNGGYYGGGYYDRPRGKASRTAAKVAAGAAGVAVVAGVLSAILK